MESDDNSSVHSCSYAPAYSKYQKCSLKATTNLLTIVLNIILLTSTYICYIFYNKRDISYNVLIFIRDKFAET